MGSRMVKGNSKEFSIKHMEAYIAHKKKRIIDVYGSTKDGSLGLAYETEIKPLEEELKRLKREVH